MDRNNLLIGFAKRDITPLESVKMGGYGFRKGNSIGVHNNIYARAVYFSLNKIQVAMVSVDVLGLFNKYVKYAQKIIEKKTRIPEKNILIHCVHNHSAPDTIGLTDIKGYIKKTLDLKILGSIIKGIINAVIEAKQNAKPSRIGAVKTDSEKRLIVNRRDPLKDSKYKIGVIRIDELNGNMRGLIINYACHGTVLPSDNRKITADYIGYINDIIEKISNNQVFSIYFNGTCGDLNPNLFDLNIPVEEIDKSLIYDGPGAAKGTFKRAREIGESIANISWDLAQKIETKKVEIFKIINKEILVPLNDFIHDRSLKTQLLHVFFKIKNGLFLFFHKKNIGNITNFNFIKTENVIKMKTEINLLQINDILFPTLPGEFFLNLGEKILNNTPSSNTFIIELVNDSAGYFFSLKDYIEGGYETIMSFSPIGGTYIINKVLKLIKK